MNKRFRAAVVGHPVVHSLSPVIFDCLSKELRKELIYAKMDIEPSDLALKLMMCSQTSYIGWNVTMPYKEVLFAHLDGVSAEAMATGAINTVLFEDGKAVGFNTDVKGIQRLLRLRSIDLKGSSIILFGAGGAARAMAYVAGTEKTSCVYVINRTRSRAESLCSDFQRIFPESKFISVESPDCLTGNVVLYVNATPLGMIGFPSLSYSFDMAAKGAQVFDMVYQPSRTAFTEGALRKGLNVIEGLDMLIWQAFEAWLIWFKETRKIDVLFDSVKKTLVEKVVKSES